MFSAVKIKSSDFFNKNKNAVQAYQKIPNPKQRRSFFILLITHYLQDPSKIIDFILTTQNNKTFDQIPFLKVIWALSLQMINNIQRHTKLAQIVTLLHSKSLIQKTKLFQNLPDNLISKANLMEQQAIDKKIGRAYTKTNYQQHKYSLLKENNEGFSKLLLLLTNIVDSLNVQKLWNKILSLIGKFDLDPDRVLDLIIQAQLMNFSQKIYLKLIQKFKAQSIAILLGNKLSKISQKKSKTLIFAGYLENFSKTNLEDIFKRTGQIPNPKLINLTCQLICLNILKISDIQKVLEPSDIALEQINYKRFKLGQQRVMKAFKISLQELDNNQKIALFNEDNLRFFGQLLFSTKLALCAQFIKLNQWKYFVQLWKNHKEFFDLVLYQPLLNQILKLIQWTIEPIYSKISFVRFMKKPVKADQTYQQTEGGQKQYSFINKQFFENLKILLTYVKDYIGFRHTLFVKLCRIFKAIKQKKIDFSPQFDPEQYIKFITKQYIVPGIGYQVQNPTLGNQAFSLLQEYPYQFRYECYFNVYKYKLNHNPYTAKSFQYVKIKQNIIVNNLSNNNKKQFVKKLAKLTHNHALQVMYWIVRRLLKQDYQSVVPQIISALNNATQMTLQMTIFMMIFYLNENKEPAVRIKTTQYQPWFKNIILFISLFFRKYLQTDLRPIFDFVIKMTSQQIRDLQDNQIMPGAYLKILYELLNKMLGSFIIEDINKTKYQILSTGPRLQVQLLYLTSQLRAAKKSKHTLQEFFWQKTANHYQSYTLAFNLLVLLAQKRAQFMQKTYIQNLKIVGDTFDEFTVLIIQLVRVLSYQANDFSRYAQLLPKNPVDQLLNKFKLPIQITFQIVRVSTKHISKMNQEQWTKLKDQVNVAFTNYTRNKNYLSFGYVQQNIKEQFNSLKNNLSQLLPIGFFTAFWYLTLDSIYYPQKLYTQKIQDLRKKIDPLINSKKDKSDKNDRQYEKNKTLYEKIKKQSQIQKEKSQFTLSPQNLKKLQVNILKLSNLNNLIIPFSQVFVQTCILPRLLLDPRQAIYCMKFVILMIKANKMSSSKSIKLLTYIIEFVMNYLPFSTKRQAQNCLATFLSQILGIFINWNDQIKLKQDMKNYLQIQDLKDNYTKLRQYLLRLFERVGNLVKNTSQQSYIIKNCLYLLQKVDAIPGYKQQAQQLQNHMKGLRQIHTTVDMKTILDMQIAILGTKKSKLPSISSQTNINVSSVTLIKNIPIQEEKRVPQIIGGDKPEVYRLNQKYRDRSKDKQRERQRDRLSKEREKDKEGYNRQLKQNQRYKDLKQSKDRFSKERQKQKPKQKQFQRHKQKDTKAIQKQKGKERQRDRDKQKQKEKQKQKNIIRENERQRSAIRQGKQQKDKQRRQTDKKIDRQDKQRSLLKQKQKDIDKYQQKDRYLSSNQIKKIEQKKLQKRIIKGQSTKLTNIPHDSKPALINKDLKPKQPQVNSVSAPLTVKQMRQQRQRDRQRKASQIPTSQNDVNPIRKLSIQIQKKTNQDPQQSQEILNKFKDQPINQVLDNLRESEINQEKRNNNNQEDNSMIKRQKQNRDILKDKNKDKIQNKTDIDKKDKKQTNQVNQIKGNYQIILKVNNSQINNQDKINSKELDLKSLQNKDKCMDNQYSQIKEQNKIGPKKEILQIMDQIVQKTQNKDNVIKITPSKEMIPQQKFKEESVPKQQKQKRHNKFYHQHQIESQNKTKKVNQKEKQKKDKQLNRQDSHKQTKRQNRHKQINKQERNKQQNRQDRNKQRIETDRKNQDKQVPKDDKYYRDNNKNYKQEKKNDDRVQESNKYTRQDRYNHNKDNYRDSRDRQYRRQTDQGNRSSYPKDRQYYYKKETRDNQDRRERENRDNQKNRYNEKEKKHDNKHRNRSRSRQRQRDNKHSRR